ncbi:Putative zinc metalloprotease [Poriferisphaera corsica]|uniref:Zinc metalloprotease n=2 Tax=Poriferisphaera corsica TaxID=2528020 RepID=A0A517YVC2_9BACT|nr:Putative zinc metalloprotease [Poriferisphaera corsica]
MERLKPMAVFSFIKFLIGFGFLIFVHELGHFLVAKWVGIKCPQFAIGFGTAMVSWRKGIGLKFGSTEPEYEKQILARLLSEGKVEPGTKFEDIDNQLKDDAAEAIGLGETEYRLNYLPLGGYVKMLGQEDMDPKARSVDPRSFNNKPIWARACVISAGVVMNVIFGFLFFILAFQIGVKFPPAIVGGVLPGMPAATTYAEGHEDAAGYQGLKAGDKIVSVDGKSISEMSDLKVASALSDGETPLVLKIDRPGEKNELTYKIKPKPNFAMEGLLGIGVEDPRTTTVGSILQTSSAYEQGVRADMDLVAVNGKPIENYGQLVLALNALKGQPGEFGFKSEDGKEVVAKLQGSPRLEYGGDGLDQNLAGLMPALMVGGFSEKNSALKEAKAEEGDLIANVGGVEWPTLMMLQAKLKEVGDKPVQVTVMRDGDLVDLGAITPRKGLLGFLPDLYLEKPLVAQTLPNTPAADLQLSSGSSLVSIGGQKVGSWGDIQRLLSEVKVGENGEASVDVSFMLNVAGQPIENKQMVLDTAAARGLANAGWRITNQMFFDTLMLPVIAKNPIEAGKLGMVKTWQFTVQTYQTLAGLARGTVGISNLRGPVGILEVGTKTASRGYSWLFFFLGLISINLAVLNFLPIPIVDGGHIVFLIIEKIKGSPASPAVQMAALYVGLALIGMVFVIVTYQDIVRIASSIF